MWLMTIFPLGFDSWLYQCALYQTCLLLQFHNEISKELRRNLNQLLIETTYSLCQMVAGYID